MLNPFKKKEESYSLDSMTLPTMNSQEQDSLPPIPSSMNTSTDNSSLPNFNSTPTSPGLGNHPASSDSLDNSQIAQENPFKDQSSFPQTQPFQSQNESSISNNLSGSLPSQEQTSSDLSKIQLETLDKKVSLIDSRMSVMEDKIEKIYQMICLEVGTETRMKAEMNTNKK